MSDRAPHLDTLMDLDTRHDDLLERLGELDRQVEKVLKTCQSAQEATGGVSDPAVDTGK